MARQFIDPLLRSEILVWMKANEKSITGKGQGYLFGVITAQFQERIESTGAILKAENLANWAKSIKILPGKPRKPKKEKFIEPDGTAEILEFHKKWHFKHHHKIIKLKKRVKGLRKSRKKMRVEIAELQEFQANRVGKAENFGQKLNILLMAIKHSYDVLGIDKPEVLKELINNPGYLGLN